VILALIGANLSQNEPLRQCYPSRPGLLVQLGEISFLV
jgi:hypothetical protein